MCERGAGLGAQAARSSLEPPGSHPVGNPEATPASTRRLLTHGGLSVGWESGPGRGPLHSLASLPLWPVRAGPGLGAVPAGVLIANWCENLELKAKPSLDGHFPPLLSAQPARGGSASAGFSLGVFFHGTLEAATSPQPYSGRLH